jgi:hypothetical protein
LSSRDILVRFTRRVAVGVVVCWFLSAGAAGAIAPAPIGDTPSDQLRVVAVDVSAFPSVTATIALPLTTRNLDESANLSVSSADTPLQASVARVPGDAEAVVLLLDTANGTSSDTLLTEQGAAAELILQLEPAIPIVVGSSTAEVVSGPSAGADQSLAGVGRLRVGGTRNWAHALDTALRTTDSTTRVAVIVLSTGADQVDPFPPGIPARLSRAAGRTYWIALSNNARPGGALAPLLSVVVTPDTLVAKLDSVAADLAGQYRVRFRVDPKAVRATITLGAGETIRTAEIPIRTSAAHAIPPVPAGASANRPLEPYRSPVVAFVSAVGNFIDANWLLFTAAIAVLGVGALALSATADRRADASRRRATRRASDRVIDIRENESTTRRVSSRSK